MLPIIHPLVLFPPANTPLLCHQHYHQDEDDFDEEDDEDDDAYDDHKEGFAIIEETVAACLSILAVT